ncbi:MAG: SEC-C metal-binding domain-containing protein [Bacteroidota bacterium]
MLSDLQLPNFNHPEVTIFYEYDLSIPVVEVEKILALPRATLVEDMETIIQDWIARDEFLSQQVSANYWASFPLHALWILMELDAKETFPTLLQILQQKDDFAYKWMSDYVTESLWEVYFVLGDDRLEELKNVLLVSGDWVVRTLPSKVAEQIYLHQPERKAEILAWYHSVLDVFLSMEASNEALDAATVSTVVMELISFGDETFIPKIEALERKHLIDPMFAGRAASIAEEIRNPTYSNFNRKQTVKTSIFERYADAMTWYSYQVKYGKTNQKDRNYPPVQAAADNSVRKLPLPNNKITKKAKKIGRNDPCPCGSGKKYKKCCLNR